MAGALGALLLLVVWARGLLAYSVLTSYHPASAAFDKDLGLNREPEYGGKYGSDTQWGYGKAHGTYGTDHPVQPRTGYGSYGSGRRAPDRPSAKPVIAPLIARGYGQSGYARYRSGYQQPDQQPAHSALHGVRYSSAPPGHDTDVRARAALVAQTALREIGSSQQSSPNYGDRIQQNYDNTNPPIYGNTNSKHYFHRGNYPGHGHLPSYGNSNSPNYGDRRSPTDAHSYPNHNSGGQVPQYYTNPGY